MPFLLKMVIREGTFSFKKHLIGLSLVTGDTDMSISGVHFNVTTCNQSPETDINTTRCAQGLKYVSATKPD